MDFDLTNAYLYTLKSLPRGKDLPSVAYSCEVPFKTIAIDKNLNCFLCHCEGFLPIPVGVVEDFDSVESVFLSPVSQVLQKDIQDKKYTWCAISHCGVKHHDNLQSYYSILLSIDESCNLHCPSCRRNSIMISSGPEFDRKSQAFQKILNWISNFDKELEIVIGSDGDPFASHIIRPLLSSYRPGPKQKFIIKTNGLLLKKHLGESHLLPALKQLSISVDAGNKEVYENVRRPGKWETLILNLDFIKDIGKQSITYLNFAVQRNNYKSLLEFVELCQRYDFYANIHQLDDWGTWNNEFTVEPDSWTISNGIFIDHNVLNKNHAEYTECVNIINMIKKQNIPRIRFSNRLLELIR